MIKKVFDTAKKIYKTPGKLANATKKLYKEVQEEGVGALNKKPLMNKLNRTGMDTSLSVGKQIGKGILNAPVQGASNAAVAAYSVSKNFLKQNNTTSLLGVSVNKRGLAAAMGLSAANTLRHEVKDYANNTVVGQRDHNTTPFAPRLPSYAFGQQSGASGDLALSMGRMKR